jgi:hypothetical protein
MYNSCYLTNYGLSQNACRFELDMLVESTGVTTRRLEELMKRIQDENNKEQICIDDYLSGTWFSKSYTQ